MEIGLRNIVLLGTAFFLFCTTDQTLSNIQKTVDDSILKDDPTYTSDTYYSQAIGYLLNSIFNWLSPSIIIMVGSKLSMIIGVLLYSVFVLQYLSPTTWGLYFGSAAMGVGTAIIWTAQGTYITLNSTTKTIARNSGIFCAMSQLNMVIGNVYVMFAFKGKDEIDRYTRMVVILMLSAFIVAGLVTFCLLPKTTKEENKDDTGGPVQAFFEAIKLLCTKNMLLLSVSFLYTGLEIGFYSGVYSSCIGFTQKFDRRKELVGASGIFMGIGQIFGGGIFTVFGPNMVKWTKGVIVSAGCFVHTLAFALIFINLPNSSPFQDTDEEAIINSSASLAMFCSFLLGLGDAIYNNQFAALVGIVYSDKSAPVYAVILFFQSVGSVLATVFAQSLGLYYQSVVFLIMAIVSTFCYVKVEYSLCKEKYEEVPTELKLVEKC